ncbi:MAG: T9SS type A sorting domain-containing protein [candidate division Zixibacteria bacterium]|nr:T9SS type A sorting domain-containing protein [candidate division Zixibacteria bacterium]
MKARILIACLALMLMVASASAQNCEVYINSVSNLQAGNDTDLVAGSTHRLVLNTRTFCSNLGTYNVTNGIRVYTPDGADFGSVQGSFTAVWGTYGFLQTFTNHFEWNGTAFAAAAAGTAGPAVGENVAVAYGGISFSSSAGLPTDIDDSNYVLTFTSLVADHGKHICIDSTFTPPGGVWKWASIGSGQPDIFAEWGGPFCFRIYDVATDVDGDRPNLPDHFALNQNYPNPFNPTTTILLDIPTKATVTVEVFNVLGQQVKTLLNADLAPQANYRVNWDGTDNSGSQVASGIYFYRMSAGDFVQTKKMMLLK